MRGRADGMIPTGGRTSELSIPAITSSLKIEDNYGSYNLWASIDAKFVDSKLMFLSELTSETN